MSDATGAAEALLGLPGFRVLEVQEAPGELLIVIELAAETVGCPGCGVVARAHGRCPVDYRDLAAFGRPARQGPHKRPTETTGATLFGILRRLDDELLRSRLV
jgi:hypothetical protein